MPKFELKKAAELAQDAAAFLHRAARRARYEFDRTMSIGPIAVIGWLALASLAVIFIAAAFLTLTRIAPQGGGPLGFVEAFWETTMRTIDAGNVGGDTGWDFRLVMLAVTLWGIFVVSALIGLLSAGVQARIDELRKGRSVVLERGHTVILNWSEAIFDIISELRIAHVKDERFCVVVLAEKDKVEMEDSIAAKVKTNGKFRVVCRSGDPGDLHDLDIANLAHAKSIVVLSPDEDDPDSQNIKTVLALVHGPNRRAELFQIAAEFRDAHNAEIARAVGGAEVQPVLADDLISRIIVHSSRQAGLSSVYLELLDFDGCEFYALPRPELAGKTYGEAIHAFEQGALIGVCESSGRVRLNPPADMRIEDGALAILIAEDRDSVIPSEGAGLIPDTHIRAPAPRTPHAERTLILGWNRRGPEIARQMARYMTSGSQIVIAADSHKLEKDAANLQLGADVSLEIHALDTRERAALEMLKPATFNHVIVLSQSDQMRAQAADTRTLVTLLHLRHIAERDGMRFSVVSEIADVRNRELADITGADDFVVSHRLVSLMLAQASENKYISAIFAELLDADGSEIYMRPAGDLVSIGEPIDFHTVMEAAMRRGETAFGYRRQTAPLTAGLGGVVLNPPKSEKITFQPGDCIVVLAED